MLWSTVLLASFVVAACHSVHKTHVTTNVDELEGATGEPLFLTPYIETNKTAEGRQKAKVPSLKGDIESYAGFITVNKTYNSNIYFWFFPAENSSETAPVAVWLQGGPGASSIWAVFFENGPYQLSNKLTLTKKKHYWSQKINMIFVDNPVGTGFSFTEHDAGYATNEVDVGVNLDSFIRQFFQLFPTYQKNDFFVTGESYAGKYIPAMAYRIHKNNPTAEVKVNLQGVAIGDGLVDPVNMLVMSEYLYEIGLLSDLGRARFKKAESKIVSLIKKKKYYEAFRHYDELLDGDLTPYPTLFYNETGITDYFDYTSNAVDNSETLTTDYLAKAKVRKSIHAGNLTYNCESDYVEKKLINDIMKSVKPWLEVLLDNYRVLLFNGQLDIIVAYPLTINYVNKLTWNGAEVYKTAERKKWYVNGELAGYARTAQNFTEVLVRDAGHMVAQSQPLWALDLIYRFTTNIGF